MPTLRPLAKELRNRPTEAEKKLWNYIRSKQFKELKFRRQQVIEGFIVDFVCFEKRLIIELDGGQHDLRKAADQKRSEILEAKGFLVLRFWNNDVLNNIEGVLLKIGEIVNPHPNPPPQGEGV